MDVKVLFLYNSVLCMILLQHLQVVFNANKVTLFRIIYHVSLELYQHTFNIVKQLVILQILVNNVIKDTL